MISTCPSSLFSPLNADFLSAEAQSLTVSGPQMRARVPGAGLRNDVLDIDREDDLKARRFRQYEPQRRAQSYCSSGRHDKVCASKNSRLHVEDGGQQVRFARLCGSFSSGTFCSSCAPSALRRIAFCLPIALLSALLTLCTFSFNLFSCSTTSFASSS